MARVHFGFMPAIAESTVPTAVADGADVDPWFDTLGRMVLKGANLSLEAFDVNEVAPALTQILENAWTQLTAAGIYNCNKCRGVSQSYHPGSGCEH